MILKGWSRLDHIDGRGLGSNDVNFVIWDNEAPLIMIYGISWFLR